MLPNNRVNRYLQWLSTIELSTLLKYIYYFSIIIGFMIRLIVSVNIWGVAHPDEIFQSLEIAHHIVFGTGDIAPEFRTSNPVYPSYAASRSWLFPMFFAMFMYLGNLFHLNYFTQTLILIKIYMAIHSTLLIPAIYKLTKQISKDETTASFAAFFVAFWFRVIEYTVRTFSNTFFLPLIFYGIYLILKHSEEGEFAIFSYLEIGFLLGISTYIRVDMGVIIFSFFLVYFQRARISNYLVIGGASLSFWFLGALFDYQMYKTAPFFSVIINWFTFNVVKDHSLIFGSEGPLYYVVYLIIVDLLFPYLFVLLLWPFFDLYERRKFSIFSSDIGKSFKKMTLSTIVTWIIYSNFWITINHGHLEIARSHKEVRFMIGGLVMFLILAACLNRMILSELPNLLTKRERQEFDSFAINTPKMKQYRRWIITGSLVFFVTISLSGVLIHQPKDGWEATDRCLTYIGSTNPDAKAIYLTDIWFINGTYTYSNVSPQTRFYFYDVQHDVNRDISISFLKQIISGAMNNSYLIQPAYIVKYYPTIYHELSLYNWTKVYGFDTTYVWTTKP